MKIWLFGGTSIYASSIYFFAKRNGIALRSFCSKHAKWPCCASWDRIDLEEKPELLRRLNEDPPSLIIYGVGFCNVAKCQADFAYANERNVESLKYFLDHLSTQTRLVYLSSDHVFGGGQGPYSEFSKPHPISAYGKSKLTAEEMVLGSRPDAIVIRTGLVIGPSISGRHGHLDWLRYRSEKNLPMTLIRGEFRSAVPAEHYAKTIFDLVAANACGIQHVISNQPIERPVLARKLLSRHNINANLLSKNRGDLSTPHLANVSLTSVSPSNICDLGSWLGDRDSLGSSSEACW